MEKLNELIKQINEMVKLHNDLQENFKLFVDFALQFAQEHGLAAEYIHAFNNSAVSAKITEETIGMKVDMILKETGNDK